MTVSDDIRASYEAGSTGFVPVFDGTVKDAVFRTDNGYRDGEIAFLELSIEPSEDDAAEFGEYLEDGMTTVRYACGKGWDPADKGATVQHESGRPRKFNNGTNIITLINAALALDGVGEVLMERGPATQANIWLGMKFTFENTEFTRKDKDGDEFTWTVRLPVAYHGLDGETAAKPAAKKAPAKKAAPAKPAEVEADDDGEIHVLTPKLRGQLKAIAASADDHDAFMEQAFAELTLDDDAEAAVADEDFYTSLKAG